MLSLLIAWVRSLVGELTSCKPHGQKLKKKKNHQYLQFLIITSVAIIIIVTTAYTIASDGRCSLPRGRSLPDSCLIFSLTLEMVSRFTQKEEEYYRPGA